MMNCNNLDKSKIIKFNSAMIRSTNFNTVDDYLNKEICEINVNHVLDMFKFSKYENKASGFPEYFANLHLKEDKETIKEFVKLVISENEGVLK